MFQGRLLEHDFGAAGRVDCFIQHSFVVITHARVLFCIGMVTSGRMPVRDSLVVSASCTRMGFGGTKPWPPDPLVDVIGLPRAAAVG